MRERLRLSPKVRSRIPLPLLVVLLAGACEGIDLAPNRPLTTQDTPRQRLPDQVIQNGTHTVTREGVKKAVMVARQIAFFNQEGKVEADTVELTFYSPSGLLESRLTSRYGEIDQRTNDMLARGQVLIIAEDGTHITGEELRYEAARDRIVSTRPVEIVQRGNRIRGQGVEADPALTNIRLTRSSAVLEREPQLGRRRERGSPPSPETGGTVPPPAAAPTAPGVTPAAPAPGVAPTAPPSVLPAPPPTAPPGTGPAPPAAAPQATTTAQPTTLPPAGTAPAVSPR